MGLISKFAKLGLAKKAFDVARQPENQAKMKSAWASLRGKAQAKGRSPQNPS